MVTCPTKGDIQSVQGPGRNFVHLWFEAMHHCVEATASLKRLVVTGALFLLPMFVGGRRREEEGTFVGLFAESAARTRRVSSGQREVGDSVELSLEGGAREMQEYEAMSTRSLSVRSPARHRDC